MKFPKNETIFELETWLGKNKIQATTEEDYYVTINKKDIRNLKVKINYIGPLVAPIKKGDKIANLIVSSKEEIIKTLLYAFEDVKKLIFSKVLLPQLII